MGVFYDGGYSGGARIAFACTAVAAFAVVAACGRAAAARAAREPLVLVLLILAGLGAASALWTIGPEARTLRWAAVTLGYAGVLAAAAVAARADAGRIALVAGIAAIAAVSALMGLGAAALHEEPYALRIGGEWRPAGPLEYPPALALLMVSALPAYAESLRARALALRVAGVAGLALTAAVLMLAQSRAGLALGLVVTALLVYRATRRPLVVVVGVVVALVAGTLAFGSGDGPQSGFLHGREDTWSAAVETFVDRPLHGTGADAFLAGSARHQDGAAIVFAHDLPLELAAELGIAGLLLALALYAATVQLAWSARARSEVWLFAPAALAFLVANLLDWPWHLAGMGAIWALGCGGLAGTLARATNLPAPLPNQGDT